MMAKTYKDVLQELINKSNKKYQEFLDAQIELGSFICSLLKPVFPSIDFRLGWYEEGIEGITFTIPLEEGDKRYEEHKDDEEWCEFEEEEIFEKLFDELGINLGKVIQLHFNFLILRSEVDKIKEILRTKLREEYDGKEDFN